MQLMTTDGLTSAMKYNRLSESLTYTPSLTFSLKSLDKKRKSFLFITAPVTDNLELPDKKRNKAFPNISLTHNNKNFIA
jgi:hypothetical protein